MNRISIDWRGMDEPPWLARAEAFAFRVLEHLGKDNWVLSLLFCEDEFIRALNRDYRLKDEATDVLSFPMGDTLEEEGHTVFMAGDIVISIPALERNAEEFGVKIDEEMKRLIIHGILHLSGMDHADNSPLQPMLAEQETIIRTFEGERIL
ncbi:MAG TPA: rRNA maturation RNase YbeY [Spirochaetaceae bacterium]|nr:rRNA maturation RNase YbeY [Spirochaetaceae bacterium]